jgi:plasmid stabilization system protein ParE
VPALPVVFTRRAARQVEAAAVWWRLNRPAAPDALEADLVAASKLVAEQPLCGVVIPSRRFSGVRRIHLARIGYHLYYRMAPRLGQVQVVAFWHARRGSPPPL